MRFLLRNSKGFTLTETIFTLGLLGILINIGVTQAYSFSRVFQNLNVQTKLKEGIYLAQNYATKESCRVVLSINSSYDKLSYGCDYAPYDNSVKPVPDQIVKEINFDSGYKVTSLSSIIFDSRGFLINKNGSINSSVSLSLQKEVDGISEIFSTANIKATGLVRYS